MSSAVTRATRALSSVCCQVRGTKRTVVFLAGNRQVKISRSKQFSLARNLFLNSPLSFPFQLRLNVWTWIGILWVFFPLVLSVFFTSTTHTNFENIFSLRLSHVISSFSWSQQCVQNKHGVADERFCFFPHRPQQRWRRFILSGVIKQQNKSNWNTCTPSVLEKEVCNFWLICLKKLNTGNKCLPNK